MTIKNTQIVEELNLPPVKIHCSVLAEDAIKSAIADYKKKRAATAGPVTASRRRPQSEQERHRDDGRRRIRDERSPRSRRRPAKRAQAPPKGAARGHPRRRLPGLLLRVRVGGQEPRPRGQGLSFEDGVRVFVDPKSLLYLDGTELDYETTLMGHGFKFKNPNAKGDLRLRRERPVLSVLSHALLVV